MPELPASSGIERVRLTCPSHGVYEGYQIGSSAQLCPRCADVSIERELRARQERDELKRRRDRMKLLQATAGIPKKFANLAFDDYHATLQGQQLALAICRAYADTWPQQCSKGGALVMTGLTGNGKTHLACAIGNMVITRHLCTVAFGTMTDYGREIRSTYGRGRGERSELQVVQALRTADLLIIDDVGAQDSTDSERKLLFDLIDGRWRDDKAIIVTSNLNTKELKKFLGTRAMDRLEDRGTVIAFDWTSYRGHQQDLV